MSDNDFIKLLNITSVCEINCPEIKTGEELRFLERFNLNKNPNSYFGVNSDEKIISINRLFFRLEKDKFFAQLNPVNDPIPKCSLIILNDFASLSKKDIWLTLANIKESGASYLMIEKSPGLEQLKQAPFYLPYPEIILPISEINKSFELYKLEKIAFLFDYEEDVDSELRSKIYKFMQPNFNYWRELLGDALFIEFLTSFKSGFQANMDFIARPEVKDLLGKNNNLGYNLRNHYYQILYQVQQDLVSQNWNFVNEKNFYKSYMIVMNYLNQLLIHPFYKLT